MAYVDKKVGCGVLSRRARGPGIMARGGAVMGYQYHSPQHSGSPRGDGRVHLCVHGEEGVTSGNGCLLGPGGPV